MDKQHIKFIQIVNKNEIAISENGSNWNCILFSKNKIERDIIIKAFKKIRYIRVRTTKQAHKLYNKHYFKRR